MSLGVNNRHGWTSRSIADRPAAEADETRLPDVSEDTGSRKDGNTPADSFGSVLQQNLRHGR
jgi:hypothetical protein